MRDYSRDAKESRDPRDSRSARDAHDYRDRESRDAHRKEDAYQEESRSYGRNHLREESSRTEIRSDSRSESRSEIRNDRIGRSRGRGPELPEKGKVFDLSVNCILYVRIEIIKSYISSDLFSKYIISALSLFCQSNFQLVEFVIFSINSE